MLKKNVGNIVLSELLEVFEKDYEGFGKLSSITTTEDTFDSLVEQVFELQNNEGFGHNVSVSGGGVSYSLSRNENNSTTITLVNNTSSEDAEELQDSYFQLKGNDIQTIDKNPMQMLRVIFDSTDGQIVPMEEWDNDTGYLNGAVKGEYAPVLKIGQSCSSVVSLGRLAVMVGTVYGNIVVFQRYPGDVRSYVVSNVPNELKGTFTNPLTSDSLELLSKIILDKTGLIVEKLAGVHV